MLTPAEITGKELVKAMFGGYDMSVVDNFIEEVAADYAALFKENAILKSKIKVLVEKVEEYRSTEDAMRLALLTAQRMGDDMVAEANKKSEAMLADAALEVRAMQRDVKKKIADEEARLAAATRERGRFVAASQELVRQHEAFLSRIEEVKSEPEAEAAPKPPTKEERIVNTARQISGATRKLADEAEEVREGRDEAEPTKPFKVKKNPGEINWDDDPPMPRPRFDFENLKFGANFTDDE